MTHVLNFPTEPESLERDDDAAEVGAPEASRRRLYVDSLVQLLTQSAEKTSRRQLDRQPVRSH